MLAALSLISAVFVGAFSPTIIDLYLRYITEPTAPSFLRNHPYQIPFAIFGIGLLVACTIIVVAEVRKSRKNKTGLDLVSDRLDLVEKAIIRMEVKIDAIQSGKPK